MIFAKKDVFLNSKKVDKVGGGGSGWGLKYLWPPIRNALQ